MNISDEAVEAAAKAGYEARHGWGWNSLDGPTREAEIFAARFALEAAAPHIIREAQAEAWEEGFYRGFNDPLAGRDRDASESDTPNPYRSQP